MAIEGDSGRLLWDCQCANGRVHVKVESLQCIRRRSGMDGNIEGAVCLRIAQLRDKDGGVRGRIGGVGVFDSVRLRKVMCDSREETE